MIKSKILTISVIVSAAILMSGIILNNAIANPQQKPGYSYHNKMMMQPGLYAFGTIASLQNDENGNPTWIVSGIWKGSLTMGSKTQGTQGNQTNTASAAANVTSVTGGPTNATFDSKFKMVMTNGSAMHDHQIYDFKLATMSNPTNTTSVFNGTATITMRQGPVENVPVSIKRIDNNVISIWADPAMIDNHFGNTPIFGTIEKLLRVEK
jgi:hypothetical protein